MLIFPGHTLSLCPLLSCCLYCNFQLRLTPSFQPLNNFFSFQHSTLCLSHLMASAHHQSSFSLTSSCLHHFSAHPRQSSFSIKLSLLSPTFHLRLLISKNLSTLGSFVLLKYRILYITYIYCLILPISAPYIALMFKLFFRLCCHLLFLSLPPSSSSTYPFLSVWFFSPPCCI